MKLLIGGSPCTYWSVAQTKNRETEASGLGWELFKNYLIARDKYRPDYFLYENNKSMSASIRAQITKELGVEPVLINSALVSAQSRQRLYWAGKRNTDGTYRRVEVEQPKDRGILLRDILESGAPMAAEPVCVRQIGRNPDHPTSRKVGLPTEQTIEAREDGKSGTLTTVQKDNMVAEPVRIGTAVPTGAAWRGHAANGNPSSYEIRSDQKANAVIVGHQSRLCIVEADGKTYPFYVVRDGFITIRDKRYPIKLQDGCYIIRKLTVTECKRLQTVPDNYDFPVSNAQAYKMLGNGWTVDVIAHIMGHFDGLTREPVEVLSMYDGMSCGHIALDKLGANVARYYATETDKYAIQTTQHNFPDVIQLGDAFGVREPGWSVGRRAEP
jgi:DNA (cytosine-5)-methyltransferase 3A